ncbi:interferon-related developmental regulator 1-like isoform X2 [Littorina saxatilis]|uniref:Interferon-related developmental regulator 1 n=1 Tax=Littorina saxatilis TaxID=31220 RepID=A0AAN9BBV9_9CAEN
MPKNNKKRGAQKKGAGAAGSRPPTDDENSTGDNWSTASVLSDNSSICDLGSGPEVEEVEDNSEQESFEDRLCECIEGLLSKSGPQRKKFLDGLKQALCKKYLVDFLEKRKETVADSLLKCVKKGKTEEQSLAAQCISLLALQLGPDLVHLYTEIQAVLSTMLADNTASVQTRAECASALAMCCFLTSSPKRDDVEELCSKMGMMEDVFKKAYRKADGSLPQGNPQMSVLNVSCLDAWCLLLTRTPDFFIQRTAQTHISLLGDLLRGSDTDLRVAAGEAIALLYDMNRYIDEDFGFGEEDAETNALCDQLKELSTESTKHIARNALRRQRSRFRDILQTVKTWVVDEEVVKMGRLESLMLEDWATKIQYNAFCNVLHSGVNIHLQENVMLREFFGLGAPLPVGAKPQHKMTKVQRKYYNSLADKARTVSRGKNRDKRSAVIGF